jgi:hypothetical protein
MSAVEDFDRMNKIYRITVGVKLGFVRPDAVRGKA